MRNFPGAKKHGTPKISLLHRKSVHFLSLEVPIFCNRERARLTALGCPPRAAVFCAKMVFKGGSGHNKPWKVSNWIGNSHLGTVSGIRSLSHQIICNNYALRFAESGWSISSLEILYWKILCSNFLQYKVPAPGSRSWRGTFGVFKHVNPIGLTCLGGRVIQKSEKFYHWAKPSPR